RQTKGKGLLLFFTHLSNGHKGIVCAMATEPIPVRATFPAPVSSVEISFWASIGTPAVLEAFDADGTVVDRASIQSVPGRKAPGDLSGLVVDGAEEALSREPIVRPGPAVCAVLRLVEVDAGAAMPAVKGWLT